MKLVLLFDELDEQEGARTDVPLPNARSAARVSRRAGSRGDGVARKAAPRA
jgi:hypothetical protein